MIALKAVAFLAFQYIAYGWLILPPSMVIGALS
jgi:hypothetical protein